MASHGHKFRMVPTGPAPDGWRVATIEEVRGSLGAVKRLFESGQEWHICKLRDGKISGPAYNFKIEPGEFTKKELGHMIIIEKGGHQGHRGQVSHHHGQQKQGQLEFMIAPNGAPPFGWRMASYKEVADSMDVVKALLKPHQWHICALADGSISGPGHKYTLQQGSPDQRLGHMLITKPK